MKLPHWRLRHLLGLLVNAGGLAILLDQALALALR